MGSKMTGMGWGWGFKNVPCNFLVIPLVSWQSKSHTWLANWFQRRFLGFTTPKKTQEIQILVCFQFLLFHFMLNLKHHISFHILIVIS